MREFALPALYEVPADANLTDLIRTNAARTPDLAVVARKNAAGDWADVSAADFLAEVEAAARGLVAAGLRPGDRVALMSRTRYEWTLLDFAIWTAGGVTVPVYETSSPEQIHWILSDSGAVACVVETAEHAAAVESVRSRVPHLRHVWQIDAEGNKGDNRVEQGAVAALTAAGADVSDATLEKHRTAAGADDPATLVYTSGTTGRPKGCVITHGGFLAECGNAVEFLRPLFRPGESSILLFLPLAHVFGRLVEIAAMVGPMKLGHASDVQNLTDDLAGFRPTLLLGVPRVFEKVYNSARAKAQSDGKGKIFDKAAHTAIAYSRALDSGGPALGLRLRHALFDRLVYGKLRAVLGGRATHAISGGAPLGERLGHFYRGIGFTVLEGYGLTETAAAITVNPVERPKIGTVGQPLPGCTIRIADDGEVVVRGGNVFERYWNNEDATAAALDGEWFRTGDLGSLDEDGYLSITGRKKEILVTAAGKNVAPAVLEDRIRAHALVAECMVVGDGRPFVAALVTLDEEFLARWAQDNGKPGRTAAELADDADLRAAVQLAVDDGNAQVSRAESVRKFRVLTGQFTEESGFLTPSLKLKRAVVADKFAAEIEALYER
ncbi:AMP-dependent synthetase/ligase [Streptomyces sp. MAR4 CNX-425]|uniref:AMP-dependent synthetase/ligase n=1 Tax=Streptomyces sp. MAR4 CNX-425 TaxID=3406343 RepID=UPI003B501C28